MMGAPVGRELGRFSFRTDTTRDVGDGSIVMVVATNAPISDRNLERVASRAIMGLARTGSSASNGSGDYVIAFSTAPEVRRAADARRLTTTEIANEDMSGIFQGVVEATEEAIYNSLTMATAVTSRGRTVQPLPLDRVREILPRFGIIPPRR
jgi:D-aminopeptidase